MKFIDRFVARIRRQEPINLIDQQPTYVNPPISHRFRDASERTENYAYGGPNIDGYNPYHEDFGLGPDGNREHARCLQLMRALSTGNNELASALLRIGNEANLARRVLRETE